MIDGDAGIDAREQDVATEGSDEQSVENSWSPKRPRTAAQERADATAADDAAKNTPEALAADIEATREELAETLDAIADKVSPKRVAKRTTKKVGDAVKEGAAEAGHTVQAATASATETVKEQIAAVREKVGHPGDDSSDPDASPLDTPTSVSIEAATPLTADDGATSPLPSGTLSVDPVAGARPVPPYVPPPASKTPLYAGGAAAALVALLLVLRRRRRRRTLRRR